jgi:hypothetical protein
MKKARKGNAVAVLSPPPRSKSKRIKLPDFAARQKRIFGERKGPLPHSIVAEERESYEY